MSESVPEHPYPVKYFKDARAPNRRLFGLDTEKRFLILEPAGHVRLVNSRGLVAWLGAGASRAELLFCRTLARELRESGDSELWAEYPSGRPVHDPSVDRSAVERLSTIVSNIAELLERAGEQQFAAFFGRMRTGLGICTTNDDRREWILRARSMYGGMGSFNDLVIVVDGHVDKDLTERLDALRSGLYNTFGDAW